MYKSVLLTDTEIGLICKAIEYYSMDISISPTPILQDFNDSELNNLHIILRTLKGKRPTNSCN